MSAASSRATRLAERFNQPEPAQSQAPIDVIEAPVAPKKTLPRAARAAKEPVVAAPAAELLHTKRTFYVRADLVQQLDAEARRLNYELGGVRLVEVLNAVLEAGLAQLPAIEGRMKTSRT